MWNILLLEEHPLNITRRSEEQWKSENSKNKNKGILINMLDPGEINAKFVNNGSYFKWNYLCPKYFFELQLFSKDIYFLVLYPLIIQI